MKNIKIDLVYLWVNGNDEEWKKKKDFWAEKLGIINDKEINNDCRFIDNEELKFSLRSAEMYAPWINKIFIVTDNQIPEWLDTSNPKIKIVDHKDIIPNDVLPIFSSRAIEMFIDKIPDLSEHFLYANDDMFFTAPVKKSYFFNSDGNPIINMRTVDKKSWKTKNIYSPSIQKSIDLVQQKYGVNKKIENIEPSHCIDAYRKSYFKQCRNAFKKHFHDASMYKFRNANSIQRAIHNYYMIVNNLAELRMNPAFKMQVAQKHVDNLYLKLENPSKMKLYIDTLCPKLLCINDTEYNNNLERKQLKTLLYQMFNEVPSWEKEEDYLINPVFNDKKSYPIVFSFDNEYSKYFSVVLQSIIENSKKDEWYDIIVFNCDISDYNKKLLMEMIPNNFSLRFYNPTGFIQAKFKNLQLKAMNYWSIEMYYRIFIPFIMQKYDKVLYLDSDIVVNNNLKELFDYDFENQCIMAVRDTAPQNFHLNGFEKRLKYVKNTLKLENEFDYFNSGMLIFNIPKINLEQYIIKITEAFKIKKLLFPDQDILNFIFQHKVKFLHPQWNVCCGEFVGDKTFLSRIPKDISINYQQAIDNPKIIHYTSPIKPWSSKMDLLFDIFWKYAKKSVYYEDIIYNMTLSSIRNTAFENAKRTNLYLQIKSGKKLLLWGASIFLEKFLEEYCIDDKNIVGIIDKNPQKHGTMIKKYKIFAPEDIDKFDADEILITIIHYVNESKREIKDYVKKYSKKNYDINIL